LVSAATPKVSEAGDPLLEAAKLFPDAQVCRVFLQARKGGQEFLFPGAFFPLTLEFQVQPYLKHLANQLACATLAS
jgi:hypothetical protein